MWTILPLAGFVKEILFGWKVFEKRFASLLQSLSSLAFEKFETRSFLIDKDQLSCWG